MSVVGSIILAILFSVSSGQPKEQTNNKALPSTLKKTIEQIIQQPTKTNDVEIEIDGLLINDTKTKAGSDFYDLFFASWEAPTNAHSYSIIISEKPFRLTSTMIIVSINDNMVYQAVLQPRRDIIESLSDEAISYTLNYLENYEEIMKQINGEDLSGSGIY